MPIVCLLVSCTPYKCDVKPTAKVQIEGLDEESNKDILETVRESVTAGSEVSCSF